MTALCVASRCGGDGQPRQAAGELLVCHTCLARLRSAITELPGICSWLAANTAPGSSSSERVSGSREAPVPVRLDVLSAIQPAALKATRDPDGDQIGPPSIPAVLGSWARLVADERRLRGPRSDAIGDVADWLSSHLDWCAAQPWVDELIGEVEELRRIAHALAPWRVGRHRLPAPCPTCDLRALMRCDGDDYVECDPREGGCGRLWTEAEYARLVRVLAGEAEG